MNIIKSPSPNFDERKGNKISMLVIHCTDGYFPSDKEWLCNPKSKVSAHYVVSPDGMIYNLVDESKCAWHAGVVVNPTAILKPNLNPNLYSIGIEVSLRAKDKMPPAQEQALKELVADIYKRNDIQQIVGHREIKSTKSCPGTIDVKSLIPKQDKLKDFLSELDTLVKKYK